MNRKSDMRFTVKKKYYTGQANPYALDPVFPLAVTSRELVALMNERPLATQQCSKDSAGNLVQCVAEKPFRYVVQWDKRLAAGPMAGRASKIILQVPGRDVELRFYVKSIEKISKDPQQLLQISVPADFRTLPVPTRPL